MRKQETDHIWPQAEGGPVDEYNTRYIDGETNRRKSARMPTVDEVLESSDPIDLAVGIDKHSLDGFDHPQNKGRGFGGLPRR